MPTVTTPDLKPFTFEELPPPDQLPARPGDADSLAALLSWAASAMWPDAPPPVLYRTAPLYIETWPEQRYVPSPPEPSGLYAWALSLHLLGQLAEAEVTGHVAPDSDDFGGYSQGIGDPARIYVGGQAVQLESWDYLYELAREKYYGPFMPDTSDLWRWSVARKGDGLASTSAAERTLPGALRTSQAMHDALVLVLPQAAPPEPEPTVAPAPKRLRRRAITLS